MSVKKKKFLSGGLSRFGVGAKNVGSSVANWQTELTAEQLAEFYFRDFFIKKVLQTRLDQNRLFKAHSVFLHVCSLF